MKKLKVGIDLDNILNNLTEEWVSYLNQKHGMSVRVQDVKEWDMKCAFSSLTQEEIYEPFKIDSFWRSLKTQPSSSRNIERLICENCEIYIVTATDIEHLSVKLEWVRHHFHSIDLKKIVVLHHKQLLKLDVLVDDYEANLIGGDYTKILFDYPWNRNIDDSREGIIRVRSWDEIYRAISRINRARTGGPIWRK